MNVSISNQARVAALDALIQQAESAQKRDLDRYHKLKREYMEIGGRMMIRAAQIQADKNIKERLEWELKPETVCYSQSLSSQY